MLSKERNQTGLKDAKNRSQIQLKVAFLALVVIATGAGTYYWFSSNKSELSPEARKNMRRVKRGDISMKIIATGVIRPVNQVKISPKFTGLLKKLYKQQGDYVKAHDLIAVMDDSNLQGQWQAAKAAYEAAQANYEKTKHGNRPQEVADAEAQFSKAQNQVRFANGALSRARMELRAANASLLRDDTNAKRLTELARQGAVSDQDRLNAFTQAEVSKAKLEQAQQDLKQAENSLAQAKSDSDSSKQKLSMSKEGFRSEDVKAAYQSMVQAEGNFKYLQSQMNDTRILAPFDGVITQKYTDEGGIVTPTTSAATTSATSSSIVSLAGKLELVAAVSETDMEHITRNQLVTITANSYPAKRFHGHVTLIAPEAIVTQNVTSFEVHASIDDDPQHLLMSGMNVNAEFEAGQKKNVLLVPTASIVTKRGKTGVYVPEGADKTKFVPVMVGETSGTKTAIVNGLKEGDQIFVGLTKEQLTEEGYGTDQSKGGPGGGSGNSAPIPRSFGRKM
ncbi:MAG: efflux RND transporter periplasmic adaptor subunit [Candidatus Obscuribacterales bacterium]|nr:efflux RND transporter periplasmic adaptor subunit [Candidatus Obscuribacterales bacterium]